MRLGGARVSGRRSRLKVAEVTHTFFPVVGGAEVAIHNLAITLAALGHEPAVVAPWPARRVATDLPYRLLQLPPKALPAAARLPFAHLLLAPWIRSLQRHERFDLWHLHFLFPTAYAVYRTLRRLGVPCLVTSHGADIQVCEAAGYGLRRSRRFDRRIRRCLHEVPWLAAITESIRAEYLALGADPAKILLLPNGIDLHRFREVGVEREEARRRLGWPAEGLVVLTVGRNHPKKGLHRIPDIAALVARERRDFLWVVVGKGMEEVERLAEERKVRGFLRFVQQIGGTVREGGNRYLMPPAEVVTLYRAADVFALPTLIEGHPLVLLEAMAAGLAVATTDAPGCRDLLEDGATGLLSPVGDDAALAAALLRLLASRELRARLGANAQREVERYDWPRLGQRYVEAFARIVAATP